MKPLARVPSSMRRSGIREVMDLAATMSDVIHLEVGEPDANTPLEIIDASYAAARDGFTKYTPNAGLLSLRRAIVEKLRSVNAIDAQIENVVVTPGAVCALATAVMALAEAGDEILIPDPGWPNYASMALLAGAKPVSYVLPRSNRYLPEVGELRKLVTPKTKLLLINSPSNPTGAVFPREVMRELIGFATEHDLYVLSDEVYEEFVFEGRHETASQFDRDGRVITVFGFSKTFAMTGWRLGYAVAAAPIATVITKLQEPLVSCASSISQKAAEIALALPPDSIAVMPRMCKERAAAVRRLLEPAGLLPVPPHGAFYAFLDLSACGADSYAIARELVTQERVAVAPGETFGDSGAGAVRISLATEESLLIEGCKRIARYAASMAATSARSSPS